MPKFKDIFLRNKTLSKNLIVTICLRLVSLFVSFFATTAYMSFFKDDVALGVWFTILSILNWILNFDLGIGNGLRNNLAKTYKDDKEKSKRLVTSAYVSLGFLCLALLFTFELASVFVDWNSVLNVSSISASVLKTAIGISVFGICLQLWLRTIVSVLYSMQKVIFADICALISNILVIGFLFAFNFKNSETNLLILSSWYAASLSIPLFVLTIIAFVKMVPDLRPQKGFFDKTAAKTIASLGGKFFLIQVSLLVMNSTNQWLISFLCKPEMVVEYQVYFKVFEIAITVFSIFTQPIWSAVTIAKTEGRFKWIRNAYLFMLGIAFCGTLSCLAVSFVLQYIFDIWLRKYSIEADFSIALIFVLLVGVQMLIYASTCIANGVNELKVQMIWTPVCAIIKIPLSFLLYSIIGKWQAVVLAFALAYLPLLIAQIISLIGFFKKNITQTPSLT